MTTPIDKINIDKQWPGNRKRTFYFQDDDMYCISPTGCSEHFTSRCDQTTELVNIWSIDRLVWNLKQDCTCLVNNLTNARFSRKFLVFVVSLLCVTPFLSIIWTFLLPETSSIAKKNCDEPFKNSTLCSELGMFCCSLKRTNDELQWNGLRRQRIFYVESQLRQNLTVSVFCLRNAIIFNSYWTIFEVIFMKNG